MVVSYVMENSSFGRIETEACMESIDGWTRLPREFASKISVVESASKLEQTGLKNKKQEEKQGVSECHSSGKGGIFNAANLETYLSRKCDPVEEFPDEPVAKRPRTK